MVPSITRRGTPPAGEGPGWLWWAARAARWGPRAPQVPASATAASHRGRRGPHAPLQGSHPLTSAARPRGDIFRRLGELLAAFQNTTISAAARLGRGSARMEAQRNPEANSAAINQSVNRVCQSINHQSISHRPPSIFASHPSHVSHRNNECLRKLYKYSHGAPLGRVSFRRAADRLTPVSSSPPPVTVTNSCGGSKWPSVLGGTLCEAKVQYCPNSTVRPRAASARSRTKHALARPTRTPTSAWRPYSRITLCAAGLFSSDHWVSHCAIIIIVANPPSCVRPQPAALPPK